MTGCCVHANSLSGAVKCEKFSSYVVNCRFSKRYPIVFSYVLCYLFTLRLTQTSHKLLILGVNDMRVLTLYNFHFK